MAELYGNDQVLARFDDLAAYEAYERREAFRAARRNARQQLRDQFRPDEGESTAVLAVGCRCDYFCFLRPGELCPTGGTIEHDANEPNPENGSAKPGGEK